MKSSARPGKYNPDLTPWVRGMHEALDDPTVTKVVAMKSAQVAWTDGVLLNYIGKRIDVDPCPMIVMFAKDLAAKQFDTEKFTPMVEVTPALADKIPVRKSRDKDNRTDHKGFPGGFLKFVGSNSPSSVKSTPAPVVAVEEPDDCNDNVRDQGDTITLLEERTKTFPRRKVIFGGTPTIEGVSRVEAGYKESDQRKFFVPCHECSEEHVLMWENVRWQRRDDLHHEVYGDADPESAVYVCPHCGACWDDAAKNRNVRLAKWRATAPFHGIAGFYINELYSPFPGSQLARLVEKRLRAEHHLRNGDDTKMRSFRNNTEGLTYAYKSDLPAADALAKRAKHYAELTVPDGGLVLTAGVDVQHNRLAVIIRAWGRGEESWLVYWGEIFGQVIVPEQGVWPELDKLLDQDFGHACGAMLRIRAVSLDSSDGQTSDAVYEYVRRRLAKGYMAIKGGSKYKAGNDDGREIFSPPKPTVDTDRKNKSAKYGVKPYIVGTQKAKDLILGVAEDAGRIKLQGHGPGRMHSYQGVRADYYDQLLAEVKAPHKTVKGRFVWTKKAGARNEALDCEVYALHAARSLKLNLWKESHWLAVEEKLKQPSLFIESESQQPKGGDPSDDDEPADVASEVQADQEAPPSPPAVRPPAQQPAAPKPKPAASGLFSGRRPGGGGFKAGRW